MKKGVTTRSGLSMALAEEDPERRHSRSSSPDELNPREEHGPEASLNSILNKIREFRRDNRPQLSDIKQELKRANDRLDEVEGRVDEAETVLQATSTLVKRLTLRQASLEARLIDQEARARRDNLRIYGIPEDKEGTDMAGFLDKLLKTSLNLPRDRDLKIERAHRALAPKPTGSQAKPRSIVVRFGSWRTKEDLIKRAWQKKEVFCDNVRFYVDHDFPPEVLKKRGEYTEARKVLKEKRIKFQTPYPAKMRIFYDDGTRLFENAAEATRDMSARGFPVTVVKTPSTPEQEEIQLLSTWQVARGRSDQVGSQEPTAAGGSTQWRHQHAHFKDRLKEFRRQPSQNTN